MRYRFISFFVGMTLSFLYIGYFLFNHPEGYYAGIAVSLLVAVGLFSVIYVLNAIFLYVVDFVFKKARLSYPISMVNFIPSMLAFISLTWIYSNDASPAPVLIPGIVLITNTIDNVVRKLT